MVCALRQLSVEDLKNVLTKPTNALTKQYQKLLSVDGVELTFTDDAIEEIARTAIDRGVGARGLRSIIESILEDTMFDLPNETDVIGVVVDADCVTSGASPKLIREEPRQAMRAVS